MFRNVNEWDKLAKWVINHNLLSHNVRWLIQIPRLYEVYKGAKQVDTFADIVKSKNAWCLLLTLQMCSSHSSRLLKTHPPTPSCTCSCSESSGLTAWTTSLSRRDAITASSRLRRSGTRARARLTLTGELLVDCESC
jgi:hypothetical protein